MSKDVSANYKRIAKNTIFLYLRMGLLMVISLFTSRVILSTLGESDYGVYNVVGGFVAMFTIISGALSAAISRFITFELGKDKKTRLNTIFCTSINVQVIISFIIVVLCEVIGIWFIDYKMNIPIDRVHAAKFVLHCSLLVFVINLISVPYNASIIAHEKMDAFAYISIIEAVLKLAIVYLLYVSSFDKLIVYAVLHLLVAIIIRLIYGFYCKKHFEECRYHFVFDKSLLKEIFSFAGWTFLGNGAGIINTQGVTILVNLFFGVRVNAARGIATQVQSVLSQFTSNFMTSINPQITKSYATGDLPYMRSLIYRSTKFSFFLFLFIAIPLFFESDIVLQLWLKDVPQYTSIFVKWTILIVGVLILGNSMMVANAATGKVKKYQIMVTAWGIADVPVTYLTYKFGGSVEWAYIIYFLIYFLLIFIRPYWVKESIEMNISEYNKKAILPIIVTTLVTIIPPFLLTYIIEESFIRFVVICIVCTITTGFTIYIVGLTKKERRTINQLLNSRFGFLKRNRIV